MDELLKMKRKRGGHHAELVGDDPGGQPLRTARDEQAEQLEPGFLGEGAERRDRKFLIHRAVTKISCFNDHRIYVDRRRVSSIFCEMSKGTIMNTTEVKELVRNWYGGLAAGSAGCCGPTTASQAASRCMGYSEAELASLPQGADLGLGCGNPQAP